MITDTFSSSNTYTHAKEMTQKRNRSNQDFSVNIPEYPSVLSLNEMRSALFQPTLHGRPEGQWMGDRFHPDPVHLIQPETPTRYTPSGP